MGEGGSRRLIVPAQISESRQSHWLQTRHFDDQVQTPAGGLDVLTQGGEIDVRALLHLGDGRLFDAQRPRHIGLTVASQLAKGAQALDFGDPFRRGDFDPGSTGRWQAGENFGAGAGYDQVSGSKLQRPCELKHPRGVQFISSALYASRAPCLAPPARLLHHSRSPPAPLPR